MSLTLGLALYFVIWWTVLFAVLPFGLRTQHEEGEVVPGTPASAPARPRLLRIFLVNTLVAAVVFAIVWVAIVYKLVTIDIIEIPGVR
jgi:predicted secreted protein